MFRTCVPTTIVVVHVWLLAVLHRIHVALVPLGWGAIHTIHGSLVTLWRQRCRQSIVIYVVSYSLRYQIAVND